MIFVCHSFLKGAQFNNLEEKWSAKLQKKRTFDTTLKKRQVVVKEWKARYHHKTVGQFAKKSYLLWKICRKSVAIKNVEKKGIWKWHENLQDDWNWVSWKHILLSVHGFWLEREVLSGWVALRGMEHERSVINHHPLKDLPTTQSRLVQQSHFVAKRNEW